MNFLPIILLMIFFPESIFAVPPPDFIIQAASQIALIFSVSFAFLSSLFFSFRHIFMSYFRAHKKWIYIVSGALILSISGLFAYIGDSVYQNQQNQNNLDNWLLTDTGTHHEGTPISISSEVLEYVYPESTGSEIVSPIDSTGQSIDTPTVPESSSDIPDSIYETPFISNTDFQNVIKNQETESYIILDARENLEYAIGHIPGSLHMRDADIQSGEWKTLSPGKKVYVVCWSGMRGKVVTTYLRSVGVDAIYLENGVDGWVGYGGVWEGEVKFSHVYNAENYSLTFSTEQVRGKIAEGILLIDARESEKYKKKHIQGSINIPTIETPTYELEGLYSKVSSGQKIIVVCDAYINCFDAKITGIELEKRGTIFLGRYNRPWEF